jgi:hypothetical protein
MILNQMIIKPGISASLYVSMVLGIPAFSGRNAIPDHEIARIVISVDTVAHSLVEKWKLPGDGLETYPYALKALPSLLPYPICREQCMCRYKPMKK